MGFLNPPKPKVILPARAASVEGTTQEASDAGTDISAPESLVTSGAMTGLTRKAKTAKTSLIGGA